MVMPRMSGTDLARQMQAARPGIRVLYMSGYTDNGVIGQGDADGRHAVHPEALHFRHAQPESSRSIGWIEPYRTTTQKGIMRR